MLAGWFWPAVAFIYAGFLLLAVDVWFELELTRYWRIGAIVILIAFSAIFSWAVVFVNAPLEISAFITDAEYSPGNTIAGIAWRPEFTEMQVWINNSSSKDYDDLTLLMRPDVPIAQIAQLTHVPNVYFEDKNGFNLRMMDFNPTANKATVIPLVLLATDAGYKMHCSHLAAGASVKVVIALADIRWCPSTERSERPIEEQARDKDYVLRTKFDDFSTYWQGHSDGYAYTPRPTSCNRLKAEGEYKAVYRVRTISQKIEVGGKITIKRQ